MAIYNETPQTGDMLQAVQGLNYLVNGSEGNTAGLANLPAAGLKPMLHILGKGVDSNTRPRAGVNAEGNLTRAEMEAQAAARDKLKDISSRIRDGVTPIESNALKSAMYVAGYEVDFASSDFSIDELANLDSFNTDYLDANGASLDGLRTGNITEHNAAVKAAAEQGTRDAAAVAEAAALDQSLNSRLESVLVYTGYMKAEDIGNDIARVVATKELLVDHQWEVIDANTDVRGVLRSMYEVGPDGVNTAQVTQSGLEKVLELTDGAMVPARLESDIESENPQLVSIAQNYLITQGYDDLTADGVVRTDTVAAAEELLAKPQTIPEGIIVNGEVNYNQVMLMSDSGQLVLPSDDEINQYLSADEYETWQALNAEADRTPDDIMSREEFAAYTMLDGTDGTAATYQKFLDNHNAAHKGVKLDVVAQVAVIDLDEPLNVLPVYTTVALTDAVETLDPNDERLAASNPLGFKAPDMEQVGGMPLVGASVMNNAAIAKTQDDLLVYNGPDVAMNEFAGILKQSQEPMSMDQVIYTYQSMKTTNADLVNGANSGLSQMPAPGVGDRISMLLGDDPGTLYDMDNAADLEKAMKGAAGYEYMDEVALGVPDGSTNNFLYSDHEGLTASLESAHRVAQGTPLLTNDTMIAQGETAPVEPETAQSDDIENVDVEAIYANADADGQDPLAPTIPMPQPGVNIIEGSLSPMSFIPQSQIQISLPNFAGNAPQSVCTGIFNDCAAGAPISMPEMVTDIDMGIPSAGNNLGGLSKADPNIFKPF